MIYENISDSVREYWTLTEKYMNETLSASPEVTTEMAKAHQAALHNLRMIISTVNYEKSSQDYWGKISAKLMDTDEENHRFCDIILSTPEDQGLSENDKNVMTEIWQHPIEGIITFKIAGNDSEFDLSEYPEFWEQVYEEL